MTTSLDSSKRLYELSGWHSRNYVFPIDGDEYQTYTLEYLLDKLPATIPGITQDIGLSLHTSKNGGSTRWGCRYGNKHIRYADNPTNAAALLAIHLFEQKILVKERI